MADRRPLRCCLVFFFSSRRRHTRWPRDWSSDVCSSDLCHAMSAEWLTAIGTIVLAAGTIVLAGVAIFQDTIRDWVYHPILEALIQTLPPDCIAVPFAKPDRKSVV